jgi:anthranilate phosphoribosyltransferase
MRHAFAAILDGGASDLEIGALMAACAAMRAHRDDRINIEILLALAEAIRERSMPIAAPQSAIATVVIPNYGERDGGNAVPLIALTLQRLGVPVLIHGAIETSGGLANCGVLRELGILPATTRGQAERALAENGLSLLPLSLTSPGLAAMMALKNQLGVSTPAHLLADMLTPLVEHSARSLHVLSIPDWLGALVDEDGVLLETPLLVVDGGQKGLGNADSRPRLMFRETAGSSGWQLLFAAEAGVRADNARSSVLPADAVSLAAWTRSRFEGKALLPVPVINQLACCLYGCGYAQDFNQAKAIAAVEAGGLAAA